MKRKACFKHYSKNDHGLKGHWEKKRELEVEVQTKDAF